MDKVMFNKVDQKAEKKKEYKPAFVLKAEKRQKDLKALKAPTKKRPVHLNALSEFESGLDLEPSPKPKKRRKM